MEILEHIPLAPYTTLHIGGPARFFAQARTPADLLEALHFARIHALPTFILGGGSNLVVPDAGYPGLVLQAALASPIERHENLWKVPAGTDWDALVLQSCQARLSGIECLAGIPGLVGGSPVQNIGAYGQEVAQTITEVNVLNLQTLQPETLPAPACRFAYRSSIFNSSHRNRFLVTAVTFRLSPEPPPQPTYADLKHLPPHPTTLQIYHAVREIRARKAMLLTPGDPDSRSAGSFFKNPVVPLTTLTQIAAALNIPQESIPNWPITNTTPERTDPAGPTTDAPTSQAQTKLPAAWLIEQAGFPKGFQLGPVAISTRHTLALTNRSGHATARDLFALRDLITTRVEILFGVTLHQEPVVLE